MVNEPFGVAKNMSAFVRRHEGINSSPLPTPLIGGSAFGLFKLLDEIEKLRWANQV
jgi:hypothetical protein